MKKMKPILISRDKEFPQDALKQVIVKLNEQTSDLKFELNPLEVELRDQVIKHPSTFSTIDSNYFDTQKKYMFGILFTEKPYKDDWFYYEYDELVIVSMSNWEDFTSQPFENGLVYLIGSILALEIDPTVQHKKNIGCINDYLYDKKGIDDAIRQSSFCQGCLKRLRKKVKSSDQKKIFKDLQIILDDLSMASRWDQSIFEFWAHKRDPRAANEPISAKTNKRKPIKSKEIHVLIASPGDVQKERQLLLDTLDSKFRREQEDIIKFRLITTGWEHLPSVQGYAQDVINRILVKNVDVIIGIFKHKLGTPTIDPSTGKRRADSGAAEEILYALNGKGPLGMVYFNSKPPSKRFDNPNIDDDLKEYRRLQKFKKDITNKVIYKNYKDPKDLIQIVSSDLAQNIKSFFREV